MAATVPSSSSTDDEENTPECLNTSKSKHCYVHITSVKHEEVNYFTTVRWNTYRTSLQKWLGLKGESRDVAENFKHCVDVEFDNIPEDAGFHHTCYRRFTDKNAITKVERRLARERQEATQDHEAIPSTSSSTSPTKKLRSRSGLPIAGSGPVIPALCIICQKNEKLINRAGKRQRDPLSKAETLTEGQLQKAAELKDDQSILILIKDKDCVALEVQYHKGCYNQYTRFLTRPEKPEKEQNEPMFDVSYKIFCERIIRQRLLVNKEVLRMGQLRKAFIELVKGNEGLDASDYRQDMLKKRLTRDFPQLVFHIPTKRNICGLVFAETLSTDPLMDMLLYPSDVQQLLVVKEEVPPEQQDWISILDQEDPEPPHIKEEQEDPELPHIKEEQEDPELPHIKEEQEDPEPPHIEEDQEDPEPAHIKEDQEELWTSQEGEQLQGLEEAGIKFSFTPVKSEDDEEEAQSSQLHQRQTEQMETEADGADCGGSEPGRKLDPERHPGPDTDELEDTTVSSSSSTDAEENTPECLNTSKSKHCYVHITSVKHEEVNYFTTVRWNTYRTSLQKWLGLKGESRDVAENFKHCVDVEFDNIPEDAGFHHTCYRRFTDKNAITKVERRLARERQEATQDHEAIPSTSSSTSPTKKLRSRSGLPIAGSGPVIPALCIICQKNEKLINRAGKRQRDPLSKAETLTAGQLQKAAELKDDQSILILIKDKDCVALEVQYHKGCYNQYTRFLTRPEKPEKEQNEPMFDVSYKIFCERIIRQRLLVNKEVLRMGQLRKAFIELVKGNEGLDASDYRQDMLKKRLTRDFPQLVFHIPTKRNICGLVFAETLSTDPLMDMLLYPSGAETTQSSELSQTDSETEKGTTKCQTTQEDARTLYTAALSLKRHLSDTPGMSCP